jgi:hypothetical protein
VLEGRAPEEELAAGIKLLPQGGVMKQFMAVDPLMVPKSDGKDENIFISKSYDATSHFETVSKDALGPPLPISAPTLPRESHLNLPATDLYARYAGETLTLVNNTPPDQ